MGQHWSPFLKGLGPGGVLPVWDVVMSVNLYCQTLERKEASGGPWAEPLPSRFPRLTPCPHAGSTGKQS